MTTTMHDTTLYWQDCPVGLRLQRELEQARAEREQTWSALTGVDLQFREEVDAGRAYIGTTVWRRWRDLLDQVTLQSDLAPKHLQATLAAWGESIREHTTPQPTENEETDDGTGEAPTTAQDDDMPCMVDLGCDHCDMCENGHGEDDEPMYLCGSFINAQTELHAKAGQRETEEDDMLRNAVRDLEHGNTIPIRHFSIGSRQGRRDTLRELLDDMIAELDNENNLQHAEALAYREGVAK